MHNTDRTVDVWVEVRDPQTHKLLFRFNPRLLHIEIVLRRRRMVVDLKRWLPTPPLDKIKEVEYNSGRTTETVNTE